MTTAVLEPKTKAGAKLSLPLKALQAAMATVSPAVERKSTIPILGFVRVQSQDGAIEFAATNLDLAIRAHVTVEGAEEAKPVLLPALKLESYAKLLQGDVVKLSVGDSRATLSCGRSVTKLPVVDAVNFPTIVDAPGETSIRLKQAVMERLIRFVGFAISAEESRYVLNGALVEVKGDTLSMVATDGHRLSRVTVPVEADATKFLAPRGFLVALDKAIGGDPAAFVKIEASDENVFASVQDDTGRVTLTHRKLTGQFPNYEAVMPKNSPVSLQVSAEEFAAALKRCAQFADSRSGAVKLTVSPKEIALHSATTDAGETDETVDIFTSAQFEPFAIGFCADYLLDAFSRLEGTVRVYFGGDGMKPMLLEAEPEEGETFEYVVMPMRV
jgi:DNA polymerase-3 subunit beta